MKKRILSLIASIGLILVAVIGMQNEKVVEAADNMVLLENRHPGYWEYLSPKQGKSVYIPPADSKNLLISDIESQEQDGVTLTVNGDHSITLNGENTSGKVINFVLGKTVLPDGDYIISDGADLTLGVAFFVWADDLDELAAYGGGADLSINNDISTYHCGIHIDPGAVLNNVTVYPMIRNSGDDSYSPYLTSESCGKAMVFNAEKSEVSDEDIKVFEHYLRQYSDYEWVIIRYLDGTGTQWKDDTRTDGIMDSLGRI